MAPATTIIFGPTGQVASLAARAAQERGAKVILAMRDPQKTIPDLSPEQEKAGGFERVQADLTQPESVRDVASKTGAKRAFIYLVFGASNHMGPTVSALKEGGVEFVVFLSSYSVKGDLKAIPGSEHIPFAHAQVELNLEKTFGTDYVAVRPAWFASNAAQFKKGVISGDARILCPDSMFDWISPVDIGRVSGALLAAGPGEVDEQVVTLCGPELISQRDAIGIIGGALGKEIKVSGVDDAEALSNFVGMGTPESVATYLIANMRRRESGNQELYDSSTYEEGSSNVQKYTGKKAMTLQEWVDNNKQIFAA